MLEQDYPDLEYIAVDGGSTDESHAILTEYRPRLTHVLIGTDRTMYDGIAKGFDRARGDVLAWLNSDDLYEPGILRRVGEIFAANPGWEVIYFDGTVWKQGWRVPNRPQRPIGLPELLGGHILYQDNVFFRRRAYEAVGGLERERFSLAGDYDLWLRLAARYRFHYVPEHGSCFRIRPGQLSGNGPAYAAEMKAARARFRKTLPRWFEAASQAARTIRRLENRLRTPIRPSVYSLKHEELDWAPVDEARSGSLRHCCCPVCGEQPRRLLFSTPDTRFGDRTLRRVYHCAACEVAFLFPRLTDEESARLHERAYSHQGSPLGDPPPGKYSPYRLASRLDRGVPYRGLGYLIRGARWLGLRTDDIVPIQERPDAALLEIGCFEGRVLDWYRQRGHANLWGTDFNATACRVAAAKGHRVYAGRLADTDWPGQPMDALILNQLIEHVADPVGLLASLRGRLVAGGRLYLSTPNLDSAWRKCYGPTWAHWHFPFHHFITGHRGLREIARRAGYQIRWLRTNTPTHWAYLNDRLGVRGLGGYVSHHFPEPDPVLWRRCLGATVFSALFHDWRGRGDCLHACLVPATV